MKEEILGAVVEVEKEIAEAIELENITSKERLDTLRKETGQELTKEKKRLQYSLNRNVAEAQSLSANKARNLITGAQSEAERLNKISDDILKGIIRKYIVRILP